MINIFFFLHDHSGARTYADELLSYCRTRLDLVIYMVFFESRIYKEYCVVDNDGYTEVHLPLIKNQKKKLDKCSNRYLDLMQPILMGKENLIFHLNFSTHCKLGWNAKKLYGVKLIYTLHFLPDYFSYMVKENLTDLITNGDILEREIIHISDKVICVTKFAKEVICKWYNISQKKVKVIHNGYGKNDYDSSLCEDEKINTKMNLGFNQSDELILFVGLIEDRKGVKYLVKAFNHLCNKFPKAKLVIVGSGNYSNIFEYARECRGKITLTGKISHEEVKQFYQAATIGVITSIYEQCSYVALEMMKSGLPVIATSAPGLCELYSNGRDSILIPLHAGDGQKLQLEINVNELVDAIKQLLSNKRLKAKLSVASKEKWMKFYTNNIMGEKTTLEYYSLFKNPHN